MNNTDRDFLVGYYVVAKDEEFTDRGFACAAWFKRILVKAGSYPVMARKYAYHERDRCYMNKLDDRALSIKLTGTVVGADFQGRYFGQVIGGGHDSSDKYIGTQDDLILSPYVHATAKSILEGISSVELLPEFEAQVINFTTLGGAAGKTYGIFRKEVTPKLWVLMLEDGTELAEGCDLVDVLDDYEPEDGTPGYRVVEVTAIKYTDLVTRDQDGNRWRACSVEDNHVSAWQPEARGSRM